MARLGAGDYAGAAKILEQMTAREPQNGRAWRNLAVACQNLKQLDRAIAADERALEVEPAMPTPLFSLGVVYAMKGDKEQAFSWLAKAKATRKVDMSQIEATPELAAAAAQPFKRTIPPLAKSREARWWKRKIPRRSTIRFR
jgi:Flp pilus assembly protein TadD